MGYEIFIGDRAYSSWSMRGWLLFDAFGLRVKASPVDFLDLTAYRRAHPPARQVPATLTPEGDLVWDSLAIAETLAERFPEAGHWPAEPAARAAARSLTAEMHSGFAALRAECPMNLRRRYDGFHPSEAVREDAARAERLWSWARERWGEGGPWLFGAEYCVADAFFAPLAARFSTYGLAETEEARAYVAAHHAHPPFRRWRAAGMAGGEIDRYEFPLDRLKLEGPAPRPARVATEVDPVNAECPYSSLPVAEDSLAVIDGVPVGFCNPGCRDKSVADAAAWPALVALLEEARRRGRGS